MARKQPASDPAASRFAPLTENRIKAQTDSGSFSRGRSYYRQGRIHDAVLRDDAIEALCEGSEMQPYRVRAMLASAGERGDNPRSFSCSCPRGGFCKHVVAMLLTWINDPDQFVTRPPLTDLLDGKSREELITLVERMLRRHPELERLIDLPIPAIPGAGGSPNEATVDPAVIRKQARSALSDINPWEWDSARAAMPELRPLLELGQSYASAGQWANAQVVFAALAAETCEWLPTVRDEEGEIAGVVIDCDKGLAGCLGAQADLPEEDRLSPDARRELIEAMYTIWRVDVFELGGIDLSRYGSDAIIEHATADERAMVEGWLRDEDVDGTWGARSVVGFLSMLREAAGASDEEVLALYRAAELWDDVAILMVQMDRIDEAIMTAARYLKQPYVLISFANVLVQHGGEAAERAMSLVDDRLWELEGTDPHQEATLQGWLVTQYGAHDRPREALAMAERRFRRQPTIQYFLDVQRAAQAPGLPEGAWDNLRAELIMHLRTKKVWDVLLDIHLQAGDAGAALEAFDLRAIERPTRSAEYPPPGFYADRDLELANVVAEEFPDRAVEIWRRKAELEIRMRSRPNYQIAAKHLARVKATLERHGRHDEWKALIREIRESNKTLRALREELDALDLM